ncbi:MAG: serine/threonine-protein kinase [Chloroflexota bacterium]
MFGFCKRSSVFGEVYLAKQKVINRDVAIKVILPLYANREDFIRRFDFEAELIANLENPYVVPIYDYWRDPTAGAYLVMRYIKDNLADHLYDNGALGMIEAARLLEQIASALHTAHRKRVIHQDIKPANILLDDDGNTYLTDFGIARDIDANVDLSKDDSNTMHGSPKYISPEHLRRREITVRSDIYSLGILMYEVLTGHPPFDHDDMLQLLQMHIKQDLPPLSKYVPELPDALNQPLQQATLKDPMMRYGSVMDFARDFQMVVMQQGKGITGTIRFPETWVIEDTQSIEVRNPYKGLRAFKESDKDDFYGREALIKSLMDSMVAKNHYQRFMAIVGASGSGKSSVVRAGLIPALRNGDIPGLPPLFISTMIPGNAPMRSLEGAILRVASRASVTLMETIAKDKYDLNQALISALPDDGELVLLIDQFEELFTQVTDESKRQTFLDMIYEALTVFDSRLRVIATLRADFLDLPLQYNNKWGQLFRERMELIPAMSQVELRSAVEDPAQANGLSFEIGLTAMILADVNSERESPDTTSSL